MPIWFSSTLHSNTAMNLGYFKHGVIISCVQKKAYRILGFIFYSAWLIMRGLMAWVKDILKHVIIYHQFVTCYSFTHDFLSFFFFLSVLF